MKIINIDVKDEIIVKNIEDVDTGEITGISSKVFVPTGNYNNIIVNFDFHNNKLCEDMNMFASFNILNGACVDVALEKIVVKNKECEYACYIPAEVFVKECEFSLGLYGYALNEDGSLKQRVSFVSIKNEVVQGTYDPEASEGTVPSPTVFEVYFNKIKNATDIFAEKEEIDRLQEEINNLASGSPKGVYETLEELENANPENGIYFVKENGHIYSWTRDAGSVDLGVYLAEPTEIDKTLTIEGAGADAKVVGGKFKEVDYNTKDNTFRIKRLETDIFDSGEASGSSINIKDSTLSEFQELGVDGVCEQNVYNGYNLFNGILIGPNKTIDSTNGEVIDSDSNNQYVSELHQAKPLTKYIMNNNIKTYSYINIAFYDKDEKFLSCYYTNANNEPKFETVENTEYIRFNTNIARFEKFQFELGEVQHDLEPHTRRQPSPNPDYPQEIEVIEEDFDIVSCGKNLFDIDNLNGTSNSVSYSVNEGILTLNGTLSSDRIEIELLKPLYLNGTYTFSKDYNSTIALKNSSHNNVFIIDGSFTNTTDTVNDAISKITIYQSSGTVFNNTQIHLQIEQGSTATEYEPYQETKVTFEIPEGEFVGSINDTIKDETKIVFNEEDGQYHLVLNKMLGRYKFNGSENSVWEDNSKDEKYKVWYKMPNSKKLNAVIGLSNYFINDVDKVWLFESGYMQGEWGTENYIFIIPKTIANNSTEFLNFAKDKLEVYYPLEEPYEVDLGVIDMPLSYYPVTNVFTNHNLQPVINVNYYRDIKNTITTMQTDIEALKQAVSTLTVNQTNLSSEVDLLQEQASESEVVE